MNNTIDNKLTPNQPTDIDDLIQATMQTIKEMAKRHKKKHQQHTLQTTEIVHETYLKLIKSKASKWQSKNHFLVAFSYAMKSFLVDQYRKKTARKRGDGLVALDIDSTAVQISMPDTLTFDWLSLELKLEQLHGFDPVAHDVVLLRYFAGLEIPDVAVTLDVSERTVSRKWTFARTWLHTQLS